MNKKPKQLDNWEEDFIEKGADLEHQRWSRWQAYLFSQSNWTKNGYLIPKELCLRWQRQIDTPYSKLSEEEKESDRKEVKKYLPLIRRFLKNQEKELKQRWQEELKENKESFIGILTDEEAEKMRKEVNSFRERFNDDIDKRNKVLFEEQECKHHWVPYQDDNSTFSVPTGYWICDKCGKIKFPDNTSTSYTSYPCIVWRK